MKKNHYIILFSLIVVISIIIVCIKGFNVRLEYAENTSVTINIGKEFNVEDIKSIANEVFEKKEVIVQQVEVYKDVVQITVKDVSDEQLENLKDKINEKYELDRQVSDFRVEKKANTRLKDIVAHYILPVAISFVIIHVYELIRFRKLGNLDVICITILPVIISQIALACVYAICRIPIGREAPILSMAIYCIAEYKGIKDLIKKEETNKLKEKSDEPVREK